MVLKKKNPMRYIYYLVVIFIFFYSSLQVFLGDWGGVGFIGDVLKQTVSDMFLIMDLVVNLNNDKCNHDFFDKVLRKVRECKNFIFKAGNKHFCYVHFIQNNKKILSTSKKICSGINFSHTNTNCQKITHCSFPAKNLSLFCGYHVRHWSNPKLFFKFITSSIKISMQNVLVILDYLRAFEYCKIQKHDIIQEFSKECRKVIDISITILEKSLNFFNCFEDKFYFEVINWSFFLFPFGKLQTCGRYSLSLLPISIQKIILTDFTFITLMFFPVKLFFLYFLKNHRLIFFRKFKFLYELINNDLQYQSNFNWLLRNLVRQCGSNPTLPYIKLLTLAFPKQLLFIDRDEHFISGNDLFFHIFKYGLSLLEWIENVCSTTFSWLSLLNKEINLMKSFLWANKASKSLKFIYDSMQQYRNFDLWPLSKKKMVFVPTLFEHWWNQHMSNWRVITKFDPNFIYWNVGIILYNSPWDNSVVEFINKFNLEFTKNLFRRPSKKIKKNPFPLY